jgi:hypothetical protein
MTFVPIALVSLLVLWLLEALLFLVSYRSSKIPLSHRDPAP